MIKIAYAHHLSNVQVTGNSDICLFGLSLVNIKDNFR